MTPRIPDTRQRLVVLSRDDYNRARSESPKLLVDPFTRVVVLPLRPPDSEDPALLALGNALQPRAVLLRNRWGGAYVDATDLSSTVERGFWAASGMMVQVSGLRLVANRETA